MNDVLVINSYAGSLVLGAQAGGFNVVGSFEDAGYGIAAQKANFPELTYVDQLPWPVENPVSQYVAGIYNSRSMVKGNMVIAHPPCAAFSSINMVKDKRGTKTDAFECHRRVMEYALGGGCSSLAIESVPGALKAAGDEYVATAEKHGYNVFFIQLNACSFAVPQWRPRFWAVFMPAAHKEFGVLLEPRYVSVESILERYNEIDPDGGPEFGIEQEWETYQRKFDLSNFDWQGWLRHESLGGFPKTVADFLGQEKPSGTDAIRDVCRGTGVGGFFAGNLPRKLDPTSLASVLLGSSFFLVNDRPVTRLEYQRIMGFPDSFQWPVKMRRQFKTYLSKGVCPPVATWILQQMQANLQEVREAHNYACRHGEVLDLQPHRPVVDRLLKGLPVQEHVEKAARSVSPKAPRAVKRSVIKFAARELPTKYREGSHAYAVLKALTDHGPGSKEDVVGWVLDDQLMLTSMELDHAVGWMLNTLKKKGEVILDEEVSNGSCDAAE